MMVLCYEAPLQVDLINLQDDASNLVLGNLPDGNNQLTPPWYIALELQDLHLHNCLYDSGVEAKLVHYQIRYQDSFVDLDLANSNPMTGPDAYQNPVPADDANDPLTEWLKQHSFHLERQNKEIQLIQSHKQIQFQSL